MNSIDDYIQSLYVYLFNKYGILHFKLMCKDSNQHSYVIRNLSQSQDLRNDLDLSCNHDLIFNVNFSNICNRVMIKSQLSPLKMTNICSSD